MMYQQAAEYNLYTKSQRNFNLLRLIIDLSKVNNIHIYNQITPNSGKAETIVAFPELRRDKGHNFDVTNEQVSILKYIQANTTTYKQAVVLVDREFCSSIYTGMHDVRKQFFADGHLYKIIELPKTSFHDLDIPSALLFFDFTATFTEVDFISPEREVSISYDMLATNEYCLNSKLYDINELTDDTKKEYKLDDLIDINHFSLFYEDDVHCITDTDLSSSLVYALKSRRLLQRKQKQTNTFAGPFILLGYNNGVKLYVHRDNSRIACPANTYAIRVKSDKVDTDYLAYLLLDKSISDYLAEIVNCEGMFMPRDLLYRKVAIHTDINIQKQIVEDALIKERQLSGSGVEYNIVVISADEHKLDAYITDMGINIFQKITKVNDNDHSFDLLYEKFIEDPSMAMVDAIIIDAETDDYEDVLYHFKSIQERNIHMYILTESGNITLSGNKLRKYFNDGNRVFDSSSENFAKKLFLKMRDDLDSSNAPQAKIRNKYKTVFEAADALDKKYPNIGIAKTIIRYIQTGCNIDDVDSVSGSCGSFRMVCHELLKLLAKKNLVPNLNPGAIPSLIKDGSYFDKESKKNYVLLEQFMSKYLSRALEYFCKVTNEGVHGSQDSSRLGTAALNILMEFVVWFYEKDICNNEFDDIPANYAWEDITDKINDAKGSECRVSVEQIGKERYFYSGRIHIKENGNKKLRPGMKIKIKNVSGEMIKDDKRQRINGNHIILYASDYDVL